MPRQGQLPRKSGARVSDDSDNNDYASRLRRAEPGARAASNGMP
jgi:hypothetical protein